MQNLQNRLRLAKCFLDLLLTVLKEITYNVWDCLIVDFFIPQGGVLYNETHISTK